MNNVSKETFLSALTCPALGWRLRSRGADAPLTLGERFRMDQGIEIGRRARGLYPGGRHMPPGDMMFAAAITAAVLADPSVPSIFEGAFLDGGYAARADILTRDEAGWHLIEVKSAVNDREEFIDDMAYTLSVARRCGLEPASVSLMLVSRDYRLGMPDAALFAAVDHTEEVRARAGELRDVWEEIEEVTRAPQKPEPRLTLDCRRCEEFNACLGSGVDNHLFDLPRLSKRRFEGLAARGVESIEDIPEGLDLTENQRRVRDCVLSGRPYVSPALADELASVAWPAHYLDFETVMTAVPLYPETAPYTQIVTQYSIHRCCEISVVADHLEYLADPSRDCRHELAERLLVDLGTEGSIIAYSTFEAAVINGLAGLFPDLRDRLLALTGRIVDLEAVVRRCYYHPGFHGSTSIKRTLPVLVPEMSYEGLDVADGQSAAAAFAYMAQGAWGLAEAQSWRRRLLEYCRQDTLAMVRLHERLHEIARQ